jgi:diamine N-acetyltransferase
MNEPRILLSGQRLALAAPRAEMLSEYHRWENDPSTILGYGSQLPQSWETRSAGYERQAKSDRYIRFEVLRTEAEPKPVGMTILNIDHYVRTAEYTILIAPEARGNGYATDATRLTLDWAFHLASLRMVWLKVLERNIAGIRAYESAGFKKSGRLRSSGFWLGSPCDEILMDALPEDYSGTSVVKELAEPKK